jgi:IMP dehydrogenase/GMP reductase
MSYCDADDIEEMWEKARFVRQTENGVREAGEE